VLDNEDGPDVHHFPSIMTYDINTATGKTIYHPWVDIDWISSMNVSPFGDRMLDNPFKYDEVDIKYYYNPLNGRDNYFTTPPPDNSVFLSHITRQERDPSDQTHMDSDIVLVDVGTDSDPNNSSHKSYIEYDTVLSLLMSQGDIDDTDGGFSNLHITQHTKEVHQFRTGGLTGNGIAYIPGTYFNYGDLDVINGTQRNFAIGSFQFSGSIFDTDDSVLGGVDIWNRPPLIRRWGSMDAKNMLTDSEMRRAKNVTVSGEAINVNGFMVPNLSTFENRLTPVSALGYNLFPCLNYCGIDNVSSNLPWRLNREYENPPSVINQPFTNGGPYGTYGSAIGRFGMSMGSHIASQLYTHTLVIVSINTKSLGLSNFMPWFDEEVSKGLGVTIQLWRYSKKSTNYNMQYLIASKTIPYSQLKNNDVTVISLLLDNPTNPNISEYYYITAYNNLDAVGITDLQASNYAQTPITVKLIDVIGAYILDDGIDNYIWRSNLGVSQYTDYNSDVVAFKDVAVSPGAEASMLSYEWRKSLPAQRLKHLYATLPGVKGSMSYMVNGVEIPVNFSNTESLSHSHTGVTSLQGFKGQRAKISDLKWTQHFSYTNSDRVQAVLERYQYRGLTYADLMRLGDILFLTGYSTSGKMTLVVNPHTQTESLAMTSLISDYVPYQKHDVISADIGTVTIRGEINMYLTTAMPTLILDKLVAHTGWTVRRVLLSSGVQREDVSISVTATKVSDSAIKLSAVLPVITDDSTVLKYLIDSDTTSGDFLAESSPLDTLPKSTVDFIVNLSV
jgi:hypothetical protein